MAKLKKALRRAAEFAHLPLPERSPGKHALTTPLDLVRAYFQAWEAKDATALGECFVEDADFINVVGLWWTGRRSIVRAQQFGFRHMFGDAKLTLHRVTERRLGDDAAVVIAQWQITGQVDPDRKPVGTRRGVISATLVRLADGSWLGVTAQNTDIAPAADTNVARDGELTPTSYIQGPSAAELAASQLVDD